MLAAFAQVLWSNGTGCSPWGPSLWWAWLRRRRSPYSARPPYQWNDAAIGAFALIGVVGAMAARAVGHLADQGKAEAVTGAFLLVMVVSYGAMAVGGSSIVALALGVALMDLGCQATHVTNQGLIYRLRPEARSRLNTAYMTTYFIAGAVGSGLSSMVVYPQFGWNGVCALGAAFPVIGLLVWVIRTRR